MGIYKIGDKFESIAEYSNYSLHCLYAHERLIGKAITDNWQYRLLINGIENGWLRKAKVAEGYQIYQVEMIVSSDDSVSGIADFVHSCIYECVAKNVKEAEAKTLLAKITYDKPLSTGISGQYVFSDGSGSIKVTAKVKEE